MAFCGAGWCVVHAVTSGLCCVVHGVAEVHYEKHEGSLRPWNSLENHQDYGNRVHGLWLSPRLCYARCCVVHIGGVCAS